MADKTIWSYARPLSVAKFNKIMVLRIYLFGENGILKIIVMRMIHGKNAALWYFPNDS